MSHKKFNFFGELRHDIPAGIIVFLVAVPLCLGIALASGAPLFSGIIAGIVGGTIVAFISGSSLGVSGPAAGLTAIVLDAITSLGAFEIFLSAVVVAGIIQILLGIIKAGIIGYYFPASVIKGMLSAIGIIIILKQIPHAFGYDKDYEGDLAFSQPDGHNTFSELYYMLDAISPGAVVITVASMAILILWEQNFIKKHKVFQLIQGPLVVVTLGIVLNLVFASIPNLTIDAEHLVSIPVASSIPEFLGQFTTPNFSMLLDESVLLVGFTIAIVASLETLLCVEATDKLDPYKRITPTNRELIAQGAGNMISGLIGGLPVTQVIVRSSANIQSGGRTKFSAFFHGLVMLIFVMIFPQILNMIPYASLASILFIVGYKLAKPSIFKQVFSSGKSQFIPFIVTILGIVFTDLLIGIGLGLVVAIGQILWNNYRVPFHFESTDHEHGKPILIQLAENVSFLNKAGIMHTFAVIPDDCHVIIDASKSKYIHYDVVELIEDFKENAKTRNIVVETKGFEHYKKAHNPLQELNKTVEKVVKKNDNNTLRAEKVSE